MNNSQASLVENKDIAEIVAMVIEWRISMISELNIASCSVNWSDWWYDSSATMHACDDKSIFKTYEDAPEGHLVVMDNHDITKVHEKGVVDLQFTSNKKLVLTNVLHILDKRKNLVLADRLNKWF